MSTTFELGVNYISEDGDRVYLGVSENEVVHWRMPMGWVVGPPPEPVKAAHDLPSGVVVITWATTSGAMDDLRERFFTPYKFRDLTKRPYKTWRNGGVLSETGEDEDQIESWVMFRLHKLAIKISDDA